MHNDFKYNKRIICVDDEDVMLETYRRVLGADESDVFAGILEESQPHDTPSAGDGQPGRLKDFEIIPARSGEEALTYIEDELANGRRIAAGFFDMRMPGGIDGYETIRRVRELDSKILCAVVTAYTDRSVEQIAELFTKKDQDELLYFNKPFRTAELRQTAVNMVCSWNRKRNEEEQLRVIENNRLGLQCILDAVTELMWIPPRQLQAMLSGILYQSLGLINSEDGYIGVFDEEGKLVVGHALGKFKARENSILTVEDEAIKKVFKTKKVYIDDKRCIVPLVYSERRLGLIDMESKYPIVKTVEKNVLETFGSQMVPLILNSMFYDEIIKKDLRMLTDPLTGLYNRRAIHMKLQSELFRSARFSFSVAILMLELDNLQSINDRYGQETGDLILRNIGSLLQESLRKYDVVGRNVDGDSMSDQHIIPLKEGGFSIILAQTDEKGAQRVAGRIRQSLNQYTFTYEGSPVELRFRIGLGVDMLNREKLKKEDYLSSIIQKASRSMCIINKKKRKKTG